MDSAGSGQLDEGFGGDTPAAVLADLAALLDRAQALTNRELWDHETRELTDGLEVSARRLDACRVAMLGQIARSGLHKVDGHVSAKVMVRRTCRLSGLEATRRERQERALGDLTLVGDAYRAGAIGTDQVALIALVHRNERVREALIEFQPDLLILAADCDYPVFEQALREWERVMDTDGPEPKADTAHRNRHFSLSQDPENLTWTPKGSLGPLQGAKVHELLRRLADREREKDWAAAKAEHGDSTCAADLERTEAQRWADALVRMADMAASADPDAKGPGSEHVIVWSSDTYDATVHRVTCTDPRCTAEAHRTNRWYDPSTYRCETLDGHPLEPVEALFDSFHHHVRVVLVTGGQPTHVGSKRRLFTGRNRLAVKLQSPTCIWPGCWVPTSVCEADHAHPHTSGGRTEPENGAPLCGRHNRWKQKNYTTQRDPDTGRWRTYRPDGSEID
ncbi:MAG: DUF222 domain-containing protein [Acidimicrobiales bacterium]